MSKGRTFLSKRQKAIIRMMAQMGGKPVTVAAISEKLSVSDRTILRDMPVIEKWFSENDFKLVRKRGKGMTIDESPENLSLIQELLHVDKESARYGRDERRVMILGTLFFAVSPVKAYVFTSQHDISEGTLYADLDVLETWLNDYGIRINRRPGLGIFITGEETSRRQAIVNALFELFDINRIPALLNQITDAPEADAVSSHPLMPFFQKKIILFARECISYCEDTLKVEYVDNSQISLITRISLAIYRMCNERFLRTMPGEMKGLENSREFRAAKELTDRIADCFDISVPAEETAHLAVYLATSRVWTASGKMDDPLQSIHLRHVVLSMVGIAERMTDIPFRSDRSLIDDLAEHVAVMKKRISMDLIAGNTQTDMIREKYPGIYSAVETACQVLTEWIYPKDLKDSDVGLIAIHFAAAAERIRKNAEKVAVAVVCPLGIASSKMLAASLIRSFPEIEVRKITSAFSIDEDQLHSDGIDLIISTAEIPTTYPHLCVDKVLQVQDKMRIRNYLTQITADRDRGRMNDRHDKSASLTMEDVRILAGLGTEISELVEYFSILTLERGDSAEDLMSAAAAAMTDSDSLRKALMEGFKARERISGTYIKEMEICLLHCRSNAVAHSRFIYISLSEPMASPDGLIRGAVAMAVPEDVEDEILIEPVGRLSALLVEDQRFLQALLDRDQAAGTRYIEKALVKYYQQEVLRIMEV